MEGFLNRGREPFPLRVALVFGTNPSQSAICRCWGFHTYGAVSTVIVQHESFNIEHSQKVEQNQGKPTEQETYARTLPPSGAFFRLGIALVHPAALLAPPSFSLHVHLPSTLENR